MDDKQQTPPTAGNNPFSSDLWNRDSAPAGPATAAKTAPKEDTQAPEEAAAAPAFREDTATTEQAAPPVASPAPSPVPPPAAEPKAVPVAEAAPTTDVKDEQVLTVGRGIRLVAKVCECDSLTVEGHFEASVEAAKLLVAQGGTFLGNAEVEEADVAGVVEGNLTVAKRLTIRAGGSVNGTTRYNEIVIEADGQILGTSQCLLAASDSPAAAAPPVGDTLAG